jgi:hypothetical protein
LPRKIESYGRALHGIAFATSGSGACCVATKHGIISNGRRMHWIPVDRYKVLSDDVPIEEALWKIRNDILKSKLRAKEMKNIPLAKAFRLEYETLASNDERKVEQECIADQVLACKCMRCTTKRCRCLKSKSVCGERCAWKGLCKNCFNPS